LWGQVKGARGTTTAANKCPEETRSTDQDNRKKGRNEVQCIKIKSKALKKPNLGINSFRKKEAWPTGRLESVIGNAAKFYVGGG